MPITEKKPAAGSASKKARIPREVREIPVMVSALVQPRLGANLKRCRSYRKISLRVVADESGIPLATLTRIENGHDIMLSNAVQLLSWIATKGRIGEVNGYNPQDD